MTQSWFLMDRSRPILQWCFIRESAEPSGTSSSTEGTSSNTSTAGVAGEDKESSAGEKPLMRSDAGKSAAHQQEASRAAVAATAEKTGKEDSATKEADTPARKDGQPSKSDDGDKAAKAEQDASTYTMILAMDLWCILLMLIVSFSNPGIVPRNADVHKNLKEKTSDLKTPETRRDRSKITIT